MARFYVGKLSMHESHSSLDSPLLVVCSDHKVSRVLSLANAEHVWCIVFGVAAVGARTAFVTAVVTYACTYVRLSQIIHNQSVFS